MHSNSRRLEFALALAALLAGAGAPSHADGITVRGRVSDSDTREPVEMAEIVVLESGRRTYSDDQGRFVLEGVEPGRHLLAVHRLGYAPLRHEWVVGEAAPPGLELRLVRTAIPLETMTISPGSFSIMGRAGGTRQTLSREEIEALPQVGSDIFRAVNRLPGLSSNDYAAHFGIRGGRHDETLILLDGLELHEPYHLKDFNEGASSIVDSKTIDGVELMTGGFPARFGNRRSGVFDITSRTPDPERAEVELGASFLNSHALAMGPFGDGRGSWLAFGRTGYMGLLFQFIDQADLPRPRFEDGFAKASYRLSPTQQLALEFLHAGDRYTYDIAATTGFLDSINTREAARTRYGNRVAWTTLRSALGRRTSVRTMLSAGLVTRSRDGSERNVLTPAPFYAIENERRVSILGAAQDWTLGLSDRDVVSFGVEVRGLRNRDAYRSVVYRDPDDPTPDPLGTYPIRTNSAFERSGSRFSLYLSNRWRVAGRLALEAGGRFDRATWTGDRDLSPRTSAALDLGRGMTMRIGWGLYRQIQNLDDVAALNNATRFYPSERSEQWTAGWDRALGKGSRLRVEGYLKRGSRLRPVFRNWKGVIDAFPESNEDRVLVFPRRSTGKGLEAYFDRPLARSLTARVSTSWSFTEEEARIVNANSTEPLTYDPTHPGPQDQRHAANLDFTWRLSRATLNGSFAYHSGWPSTLEQLTPVVNDNGDPDFAVRPAKIYGARLPDYLRLDLRATRRWATRWGEFDGSLEIINLTQHANVFGYDYFRQRDAAGRIVLGRGDETWFSLLPSLGLNWSRKF